MSEKQNISIIGSTGSIGTQALNIIREREGEFTVIALSAKQNLSVLTEQIKEFKPKYVHIEDLNARATLSELFKDIELLNSAEEVAEIDNVDIFLSAIVGIAGLKANLKALTKAKKVAIANKETLVVADHLVTAIQAKHHVTLIPIDSEHAAIHQCLHAGIVANLQAKHFSYDNSLVKEILLTSSGGPFRNKTREELDKVTLKEALQHPTWSMGKKITIDSSTLMNKALEVIEVHALFKIPYKKIKVVLDGQGADELLAGYQTYHLFLSFWYLRKFNLSQLLSNLRDQLKFGFISSIIVYLRYTLPPKYRKILRIFYGYEKIFSAKKFKLEKLNIFQAPKTYKYKNSSQLNRHLIWLHDLGLENLLYYGDIIAMKNSVENRSPFMDHRLVDFAYSRDEKLKVFNGLNKFALRKMPSFSRFKDIIDRKKNGFSSPIKLETKKVMRKNLLKSKILNWPIFSDNFYKLVKSDSLLLDKYERFLFRIYQVHLWNEIFINEKK